MELEREATVARIVPSGKVYKQIFDAQVQLVKALESRQATQVALHEKKEDPREKHVPVVKDGRNALGDGMLTMRQKTWVGGFPNETTLENPVLVKFYNKQDHLDAAEPESSIASREVRGLPDVLAPSKKGSDIIERIAESRKLRHETCFEDMHQELGLISTNLEPQIVECSRILLVKLEENDAEIETIMTRIKDDKDLITFTLDELEALWKSAQSQSEIRQSWIATLDENLANFETERIEKVRLVFQENAETLKKIAHLMPPDLQRVLDKEAQLINQTVLSNRRACSDLRCRLLMADIERERQLHTSWVRRVEDWKQLHIEQAILGFREYLESPSVTEPSGLQEVTEAMLQRQQDQNENRLQLIASLKEMMPPASTKTSVYKWNQEITGISKHIDELNQDFFTKMYAEYEKVCQECLDQAERAKIELIERRVCTEHEAQEFLKEHCLPVIGQKQTKFEKHLETMDRQLERQNESVLNQLKSLFKFAQGAAHVWDIHEIGLGKQERGLQEKLDECRHKHDNENQEREANLDIVMDRMRQDAREEDLRDNLKKSLECLTKIRESYDSFHHQQVHIVSSYPSMVHDELERYDRALCKFFSVDRQHPEFAEESPRKEGPDSESQRSDKGSDKKQRRKKKGARGSAGSRSSSRGSDDSEASQLHAAPSSSLPQAVSEVLRTTKGTAFYVLTVAGEHGVTEAAQPSTTQGNEDGPGPKDNEDGATVPADNPVEDIPGSVDIEDGGASAFLTESSLHADTEVTSVPEMPPYIINVHVPDAFILDVKKTIRMNFLNHVDEWIDEALKRSRSVVAAKTEELSSELGLRMHLHEPRCHRAELDVHNVRAAELVMHSERVSRHSKGITQALANLQSDFTALREEHNEWSIKYRNDIESLENVFVNATKSSKLVALSSQLQVEQDTYMNRIRASLRAFRQKLDDTLQMLRGSNARFINSFKLFSDGGNFCPSEIEEYKAKLSKMSQKTDSAEGVVMADLEGMEARRLDQASKISAEFEDRFKHHMIDLLFMEKIARWLTSTQVKIKSEVADSNTQALQLTQTLKDLHRRIDACARPNLDKESVSPSQLKDTLPAMFESFYQRSIYLNCLKDNTPRPTSANTVQGNPALGARVGFTASEAITQISRPGKQPAEDPSIAVIKNILKTQKNRLNGEPVEETPRAPPTVSHMHQLAALAVVAERPRASRSDSDRSRRSSRQGGPAPSNAGTIDGQKRITSGGHRGSIDNISLRSASNTSLFQPKRKKFPSKHSKGSKIDKRHLVFGESELPGEQTHFLGRIQRLLREALDGLLAAADIFYRQKGNRAVTRPQALQETFDLCADVVVQKLQSYYTQADEYHNHCLQEFRSQLLNLEDEVCEVPREAIKEYLRQSIDLSVSQRQNMDTEFGQELQILENTKVDNHTILRPSLGHPNQSPELSELCVKEDERRETYTTSVNAHSKRLQENTAERASEFIVNLARLSEQLLLQFDNMLTIDDVNKGRVPATKYPTSELVRRKNAGQPLEDVEEKTVRPRGKKTWTGISKTELLLPGDKEPKREIDRVRLIKEKGHQDPVTASITTTKTTLGHNSTVEARDVAYQEYKKYFEGTLVNIDEVCATQLTAEERWTESWKINVEKVKQLYE